MTDNQVHLVAKQIGTAALAVRLGRPPALDAERLAQVLDQELVRFLARRHEAVLPLATRATRAAGELQSIENGETVHDAAAVAAELSSLASALRTMVARMPAPRAA